VDLTKEEEIINDCLHGDQKAMSELYHRYCRRMMGVCMRYASDRMDAEDILQDGFITAFRNLSAFKHEGSFEGWLRRIMVNTALQKLRKKILIQSLQEEDLDKHEVAADAVSQMSEKELLMMIQKLPDGYRVIFNLYVIEGYSHAEIAGALGISESTSRSQLLKARNFLQRKINSLTHILLK
jgi:RNA polymerase sigma factor (sigma-70 family)